MKPELQDTIPQVRTCYDELAAHYHLIFDNWDAAIARQAAIVGPILERGVAASGKLRILDCACGIGTQALGLAQRGHKVTGSDLSPAAIDRARREAFKRSLEMEFVVADFLNLSALSQDRFDAIACLDNALSHLESFEQLCQAAIEFRSQLRRGGILIVSIRDYDRLVHERPVIQEPSFYLDDGKRRIVHQVWDWLDDLRYTFHLYITRQVPSGWESHHYASTYRAIMRNELTTAVQAAGFVDVRWMLPLDTGYYQPILVAKADS